MSYIIFFLLPYKEYEVFEIGLIALLCKYCKKVSSLDATAKDWFLIIENINK